MIYHHLPGAAEAGTKMETGKNVDCEGSSMNADQRPAAAGNDQKMGQSSAARCQTEKVESNELKYRTTARATHDVRTTSKFSARKRLCFVC